MKLCKLIFFSNKCRKLVTKSIDNQSCHDIMVVTLKHTKTNNN